MNRTKKNVVLVVAMMFALSTTLFANEQITMTSTKSKIGFSTNADATNIHIDWGDGTISTTNDGELNEGFYSWLNFSHQYTDEKSHTVVIRATNFSRLICGDNQLSNLDVSKNMTLIFLSCYDNQLKSLDVSKNTSLTSLECSRNQLTGLDVSKCTALIELDCSRNELRRLDVSKNTALEYLTCNVNELRRLDVSKNTALELLCCDDNQLRNLDVGKNTTLEWLVCNINPLKSLDVSTCTKLKILDVSHCRLLTRLYCNYDRVKVDTEGCNALSLPNSK